MKNILGALLVLVLVICGAYLSYTFIPEVHDFISPSTKNDTTIEQRGVFNIKYVVAGREKSDLVKDYPFLMKKSGNYPPNFNSDDLTIIDPLLSEVKVGDTVYSFLGYYSDKDCTLPFDGIINKNADKTVYIKLELKQESDYYENCIEWRDEWNDGWGEE